VEAKVEKIKEELKVRARAVQAKCISRGEPPPPLDDEEAMARKQVCWVRRSSKLCSPIS